MHLSTRLECDLVAVESAVTRDASAGRQFWYVEAVGTGREDRAQDDGSPQPAERDL